MPLCSAVRKPDVFERHGVREPLARTRRMERQSLEMRCGPGGLEETTRTRGDPVPSSFSLGARTWRHCTIRKRHEVLALHARFRRPTDAGVATT